MIGIILGSKSDLSYVKSYLTLFEEFSVKFTFVVSSAHRTPERTKEIVKKMEEKGVKVIIAVAGAAAHLPGVIASYTTLPVIGVPIPSSDLNGLDALLAIVQMPGGIPVATTAIGKAGVKNAILFAISILALEDDKLAEKLNNFRKEQKDRVIRDSEETEKEISSYGGFFSL